MIETQFVKSCKQMVAEGGKIFPGTNHSVSPGSWNVIKLVAEGSNRRDLEKLVGKTYENITRHIKGQRCNDSMEKSLLFATENDGSSDEEKNSTGSEKLAVENKVKVGDKNRLGATLSFLSTTLLNFLKSSTTSDREYLRSLLSSKIKQDLRLGVQALMSEENFNRITKEGGLK